MRTDITSEQIERYRADGHTVIEDFLSPEELAEWRDAVGEAAEMRQRGVTAEGGRSLRNTDEGGDEHYRNVFLQCVNLWQISDRVKRLILDERIGRLASELEGVDGVRVWHDQTLVKEPWANATPWHLDCPYWGFHSRHATSIWLALDDATIHNGCLFFLPGTHTEASFDRNAGFTPVMRQLLDVYPEWADRPSVAVEMRAGSCSFHNGMLAHGANANMTPGYRRAMTCGFMPIGSTYSGVQNILTDEQAEKLKVGDVMDDDEQNPVVWQGSG
ncbi:MAG: phytanoyl-CoA dioxygenase [Planctomycetaceae bacterium]|nr:phytanoyl-CoA dioxygenase [Planctomycetaceae bacterium]